MKQFSGYFAAVVYVATLSVFVSAAEPMKVFVTVREKGGFLDVTAASTESVQQLTKEIKHVGTLRMVPRKEDADIVLRLTSRSADSTEAGTASAVIPIGNTLITTNRPTYYTRFVVTTDLELPDGTVKEFRGESAKSYKDCAKAIVSNLQLWTTANRERLIGKQ